MAKQTSKKKTAAKAAGIAAGGAAGGSVAKVLTSNNRARLDGARSGAEMILRDHVQFNSEIPYEQSKAMHNTAAKIRTVAGEEVEHQAKLGLAVGAAIGTAAGAGYYYRTVHGKKIKVKNGHLKNRTTPKSYPSSHKFNSQHNFLHRGNA